jgi:hypothetical protein
MRRFQDPGVEKPQARYFYTGFYTVTVVHKAAGSLVIAVFLFAGFTVLAYTGLFDLVEARFFNPSITKAISRELDQDTETIQELLGELQTRFALTLQEPAVRRSFLPNQSAEDIFERSRLYGLILESEGGLQSIRFIDAGGLRIHYSTHIPDILRQDRDSAAYRNYASGPGDMPFDAVAIPNQGPPRITLDDEGGRIIFSFPFYDSFEVYRGTALFSLSVRTVADRLVSRGRIKVGEDVSILSVPPGFVTGLPYVARDAMVPLIASVWGSDIRALTPLDLSGADISLALISSQTAQGIYVGRLVKEELFVFPPAMKALLLASFFATAYLTIFLLFNIHQDTMTIIQNRIQGLQKTLIEEYHNRQDTVDWNRWSRELEQRQEEVRLEIKRDLNPRRWRKLEKEIDTCIDNSWTELIAIVKSRAEASFFPLDEARLQDIVNRVLQASGGFLQTTAGGLPRAEVPAAVEWPEAEEFEELDELDEEEMPDTQDSEKKFPLDYADVNAAADTAKTSEEPEELEELEEFEPLEELEEVAGVEDLSKSPDFAAPDSPQSDLSALASEIEFSPLMEETESPEEQPLSELEIVSPFATMLSDLSEINYDPEDLPDLEDSGNGNGQKNREKTAVKTSKLEMLDGNYQMSLVYRPFMADDAGNPPDLIPQQDRIIESRDGLHYISPAALHPDKKTEDTLDPEFKSLIESVLHA